MDHAVVLVPELVLVLAPVLLVMLLPPELDPCYTTMPLLVLALVLVDEEVRSLLLPWTMMRRL